MDLPLFQVDAFSSVVFGGNPAAVCPLREWLPDETLQSIAAENNVSETAYFVPNGDRFYLRWFTPGCEVDLCGHATLASAFVLFHYLKQPGHRICFDTKSGELTVTRDGELLTLDFPSRPPSPVEEPGGLIAAIGGRPLEVLAARDVVLVYATEAEVLNLKPDMLALTKLDHFGFIVTAPGIKTDFVSRFFAPAKGVPEDPVTGSAHCTLIPYWAEKLGKTEMVARQISRRGGELYCKLAGDRVKISGYATPYLRGSIQIP
jgi:PhzF family phenazine biosynthesis protein